jgi:hypothetical protein
MDKNIIKQRLSEMKDARQTPGITVTSNALKKSAKENKKAVKDMEKNVSDYEKNLEKGMQTTDVPNKFNYSNDKEVEYHNQIEIMNGQEMIQYDRDPDANFKERAEEAIVGSTRMGNNPEWANVIPKQQGFTGPEFGKKLAANAKASFKKRLDADKGIMSFGDDIEIVEKGSKPMGKHSALAENKNNEKPQIKEGLNDKGIAVIQKWISENGERQAANKMIDQIIFKVTGGLKSSDLTDSATFANGLDEVELLLIEKDYNYAFEIARETVRDMLEDEGFPMFENKNNEKPQIKEGMKRLKFKQPFNGFGNALKMIPESYKIDNKVFEMTDGNENYKIRWEGSITEGSAVILMASDKTLVNEDMDRMKALMGYKSHETLGLVKGKARLDENKIFGDIWNKSKVLLEGEDMEGADAKEGNWDDVTKKAPEATKHVEGSVKKDAAMATAKEGNPDKAVKHAPEAKKPMKSSQGANVESEADANEGNWDEITKKAPEATKHVTMKEAYEMEEVEMEEGEMKEGEMKEGKTKEGNWDEIKVPHAADAKKHIHMGKESEAKMETEAKEEMNEGVVINGIEFLPLNENWMEETLYEEKEEEEEEYEGEEEDNEEDNEE